MREIAVGDPQADRVSFGNWWADQVGRMPGIGSRFYPYRYYRVAVDGALCIALPGWDPPDLGRTPYNKSTSRRVLQAPDLRGLRYALTVGDPRLDTLASKALDGVGPARCNPPDPEGPLTDPRAERWLLKTQLDPWPSRLSPEGLRSGYVRCALCQIRFIVCRGEPLCSLCRQNPPRPRPITPTGDQLHWWRYRLKGEL
jgi:hypothetical protein